MKDLLKLVAGEYIPTCDIVVVTYNNIPLFQKCLNSLVSWTNEPNQIIVVNNGSPIALSDESKRTHVIHTGKNLGWMGGVNAGMKWCLENSKAPYILMLNDDTQVLDHDYGWLTKMVQAFDLDPKVAAVGPLSDRVMGNQNINAPAISPAYAESVRLSGMAMLVRKDVVREIGLLDESLPGGDDLDYSIRMRKAGYKLAICRRTFLVHHYGQTGKRVHGAYWDSKEHTEAINTAIIKKHGFKTWFLCVNDHFEDTEYSHPGVVTLEEQEVLGAIKNEIENGIVLDLGCGGQKIHPKAVGVDFRSNGQLGCGCNETITAATDVVADVTDLKPFEDASADAIVAKHILEHVLDIPKAIKEWRRVLKPGGKLVIVCPDYRYSAAIACDPSHVHAFTPDTCKSWLEALGGFNVTRAEHLKRSFVFMLVAEKAPCTRLPEFLAERVGLSK